MHKTIGKILSVLFVSALLFAVLTACGKENKPLPEEQQPQSEEIIETGEPGYDFTIQQLPDPYKSLRNTIPENCYVTERMGEIGKSIFACKDGVLYHTYCVNRIYGDNAVGTEYCVFQYIEPPYEDWVDIVVDRGKDYYAHLKVTDDQRMLCLFSYYDMAVEGARYKVCELHRDGSMEELEVGIAFEELDDFWLGDGVPDTKEYEKVHTYSLYGNPAGRFDEDGSLVFGTGKMLWRFFPQTKEIETIIDLRAEDIAFQELKGVDITENGFDLLGSFGTKFYLVHAEKTDNCKRLKKQEIILADKVVLDEVVDAVADFNMQSREYKVIIDTPPIAAREESRERFAEEMQREMLQGGGPDIVGPYFVQSANNLAVNGYLLELDDFYDGTEEGFWPGALQSNVIGGKRYGIPYGMIISFFVGNREKLPQKDSWNARELMEYVKESGATYLAAEVCDGDTRTNELLMLLSDTEDTTYIDWKNRKAHLNENPFLELLMFVNEYGIREKQDFDTFAQRFHDGEIALFNTGLQSNVDLLEWNALFEGHPKYIGYPATDGNGMNMTTLSLFVNANTKCKEGVYAFLRYLLSDAGQSNCYTTTYPNVLPVRKETYVYMLSNNTDLSGRALANHMHLGVEFKGGKLTEEQKEQAIYIAEHTRSYSEDYKAIMGILREEAETYFLGQKSAAAAAEMMQKRVQLYLDEMK